MNTVFLKLLNMSITAGWLILAVILVRLVLKKAPKWIRCVLWGLVAVRLILPFSFKSILSLIPSSETIPANIASLQQPRIDSGIPIVNEAVNPVLSEALAPAASTGADPLETLLSVASCVWAAGIAVMLVYALVSWLKLRKTVSVSVPAGEGIRACDEVKAPFILGVFRPVIYVPSSMGGETLDYVIRHETAHLRRRDHLWKPLGFLLLAIYWFNPLCWAAYILLCRDIEMACDEKVIRDMDRDDVAAYSQALLDCSFPRRSIAACPLAFGEVGVKDRIRSVLNYRKPAFWIILAALVACVVLAVCLLTDPSSAKDPYSGKIKVRGFEPPVEGLTWSDSIERAEEILGPGERGEQATESVESLIYKDVTLFGRKGNLVMMFSDFDIGLYQVNFNVDEKGDGLNDALVKAFGEKPAGKKGWSSGTVADLPEEIREKYLHLHCNVLDTSSFGASREDYLKKDLVQVSLFSFPDSDVQGVWFSGGVQATANFCTREESLNALIRFVEDRRARESAGNKVLEINGYEPPVKGLVWGDSIEKAEKFLGQGTRSEASGYDVNLTYQDMELLGRKGVLTLGFSGPGIGLVTVNFRFDETDSKLLTDLRGSLGIQTSTAGWLGWYYGGLAGQPEKARENYIHLYCDILSNDFRTYTRESLLRQPLVQVGISETDQGVDSLTFDGRVMAVSSACGDDATFEEILKAYQGK